MKPIESEGSFRSRTQSPRDSHNGMSSPRNQSMLACAILLPTSTSCFYFGKARPLRTPKSTHVSPFRLFFCIALNISLEPDRRAFLRPAINPNPSLSSDVTRSIRWVAHTTTFTCRRRARLSHDDSIAYGTRAPKAKAAALPIKDIYSVRMAIQKNTGTRTATLIFKSTAATP
jgi:hypothetical protein